MSFAARVDAASLFNALASAEVTEDRETLLLAWRAHPKDDARLWAWPILSAIDQNQTTGLDALSAGDAIWRRLGGGSPAIAWRPSGSSRK